MGWALYNCKGDLLNFCSIWQSFLLSSCQYGVLDSIVGMWQSCMTFGGVLALSCAITLDGVLVLGGLLGLFGLKPIYLD